jgi:peptide deformylase
MTVREIVEWPSLALRTDTHDLDPTSGETARIYQDLVDTMESRNGVGIAAPQIGEPAKIFIISAFAAESEDPSPIAFINPEITWLSENTMVEQEGCLSFPKIWLNVRRSLRCKIKASGLSGDLFEVEAKGLYARALQHETDHLNAKLMVDFVSKIKKESVKKKLKRNRR